MNEFPEHREIVLNDIQTFLETIQREKIDFESLKLQRKEVVSRKKEIRFLIPNNFP
ncbi:hypothetical protein LEP1GSC158_3726 [Leptospira interrogans serovar Zanoni str. LT2156]|uniref:Uncharacterized protein n=1 Tax=Leptospira interrogans serovar Zanoni str. LT2156 TaxID=1001601 RepID=M6HNK2_LEPIR|nr:hypothetical protein LEP1GSC158_3726 [Leptospira interrogans serovar Zanoni str. LT2156]